VENLSDRLAEAVRFFWLTREGQEERQGTASGSKDYGNRAAVTGGKQLDGFAILIRQLLQEAGLHDAEIFTKQGATVLPGFFRATKQWDLVVVSQRRLVATIEFKSLVGSFGNNLNNRTEEALGNATDLWTAYREGIFAPSAAPWLGYLMLMEEADKSTRPVRVDTPHFEVFEEWQGASYAQRCEKLCEKLVRERLYQSACFLLSSKEGGLEGHYSEPSEEIGFRNFAISLTSHIAAFTQARVTPN